MGTLIRFATSANETSLEKFGKSRQRLSPEFNRDPDKQRTTPTWTMSSSSGGNSSNDVSASPDGKKACAVFSSTSPYDFFGFFDPADIAGTWTQPAALTSTVVNACAVSDHLAAVGGNSGTLHVYSFSEGTVTGEIGYVSGVDSSGIGIIRSLQFSLDQRYLYVSHASAPYLRRYDTTDWSYVNAAVSDSATRVGLFVLESGHVVAAGSGTPYIAVYSADLQIRHGAITTSSYVRSNPNIAFTQDARNPYACYITTSMADTTSSRVKIAKVSVNPVNSSVTFESKTEEMTAKNDSSNQIVCWMYYDEILDRYAVLVWGTNIATNPRDVRVRILDPDTLALDEEFSDRYTKEIALTMVGREVGLYVPADHYYRISGTVRDIDNVPAERMVRAYRRSDGVLMAETTSDPATGNYEIRLSDDDVYDIQFYTLEGETLNDLFYARVTPERVDL